MTGEGAQKPGLQHFSNGSAHGPVQLYIDDDGEIVFVCAIDKRTWVLSGRVEPQNTRSTAVSSVGEVVATAAEAVALDNAMDLNVTGFDKAASSGGQRMLKALRAAKMI